MEDTFIIRGGKPLFGTVSVEGSKNAALPILFATLITPGHCVLSRVPDIGDVRVALAILSRFGVRCVWQGDGTLLIDSAEAHDAVVEPELLGQIRASTYLVGASLSRFGHACLSTFGGCRFGVRPIDMHLDAVRSLGGRIDGTEITATHLRGGIIRFHTVSVGATVNALLLSAAADGVTVIEHPATEPHVAALIDFLRAAGAVISVSHDRITVEGRPLHGADATVIPDMIEAGTYLLSGPVTGGSVTVSDFDCSHLASFFASLQQSGANLTRGGTYATATNGEVPRFFSVTTDPYPAFPTDLQPPTAVLMAVGGGGSITEHVWRDRFAYLDALAAFGVRSHTVGETAYIESSSLIAAQTRATDLRGGVAAVLAALSADGESRIRDAHLVLRGYADILKKFRALGADIDLV